MEYFLIGRFQLENLSQNQLAFHLLWLEDFPHDEPLLAGATQLNETRFAGWLDQEKPELNFPIVLACACGEVAPRIAEQLMARGYLNVFVIDQGLRGLKAELGIET